MALAELSTYNLITEIAKLPQDWHQVGSVSIPVLEAIARHVGDAPIPHSLETGSGKTTLLLSHLSQDHKVFALGVYDNFETGSIANVRTSSLFKRETVEFIEGPTQLTLPHFTFQNEIQVALLDGPHAFPFPQLEYYYIYPHLQANALLIVDDVDIPSVHQLYTFLLNDAMFDFVQLVETTAFFRRTHAPTFSPVLDGWWLQQFNQADYPLPVKPLSLWRRTRRRLSRLKKFVLHAVSIR